MNIVPNCDNCGDNVDVDQHEDGVWFCHNCNHNKYRICEWCGREFFSEIKPKSKPHTVITCSDCKESKLA